MDARKPAPAARLLWSQLTTAPPRPAPTASPQPRTDGMPPTPPPETDTEPEFAEIDPTGRYGRVTIWPPPFTLFIPSPPPPPPSTRTSADSAAASPVLCLMQYTEVLGKGAFKTVYPFDGEFLRPLTRRLPFDSFPGPFDSSWLVKIRFLPGPRSLSLFETVPYALPCVDFCWTFGIYA